MKLRNSFFLVVSMVLFVISAYGKGKTHKEHKTDMVLVEAYTQRTLSGRREGKIQNSTHIIAVWQSSELPGAFVWNADSNAQKCSFAKVHKVAVNKSQGFPEGMSYEVIGAGTDKIHKGDTLDITPLGVAAAIPVSILKGRKNILGYTTAKNTKWSFFPVTAISRKHDIAMP